MFLKNLGSIVKPVSKSDLPYFLTSLLFFDIFFKYTRRYYYVFEEYINSELKSLKMIYSRVGLDCVLLTK